MPPPALQGSPSRSFRRRLRLQEEELDESDDDAAEANLDESEDEETIIRNAQAAELARVAQEAEAANAATPPLPPQMDVGMEVDS